MKRCPDCGRDYNDDSMSFCLDDGSELVFGAATGEPATAILGAFGVPPSGGLSSEGATRTQIHTTANAQPPTSLGGLSERHSLSAHPAAQPQARSTKLLAISGICVLVLVGGFFGYRYFGSRTKQIESIAVMPFVNDSGNADVEYLSDGIPETLISSLSKLSDLSVKARSAVFTYKGRDLSPKQIGDELGVQAVLLGRLVQRGEHIKLSLELVDAKTLDVIWSEQYDRKQADLVNLQSELAHDVSSKLRSKLSGEDQQTVGKKLTNDAEAFRLYLQARFYLNKRVGKEFEKAKGFLEQSIERDPNFALGYVGLAEFIGAQDRPKAKEYIMRALAIDNRLSEAHSNLGFQLMLDYDFAAAERELARAIELDPNNARAHQSNGSRLMMIGRYDESLAAYDRAIALEPTYADIRTNRAACLVAAGRVDDGIVELKKAIEIDPGYAWSHSALSYVYRMKGDQAAAVEARARSAELVDRPELAARLRNSFRQGGWKAYLLELFDQTQEYFPNLTRRASILCELGRNEEAITSLNEGAAKGEWWLFAIKYDPAFDPIRGDPRFQALVKKFDPPQ
ncbi:MAG: tetratricopeptide repeat protein [Acidobacteriota bacterium]